MSNYYKFKYGDKVKITSYVGIEVECTVVARYTSTKYDHEANPHKRYVVLCEFKDRMSYKELIECRFVDDVAEGELEFSICNKD